MSLFGNLLTTYEMIQGASGQTPHSAEKDGDVDAAQREQDGDGDRQPQR